MKRAFFLLVLLAALFAVPNSQAHLPKYCGHSYKYINSLTINYFRSHPAPNYHRVETWTYSPPAQEWRFSDSHRWYCP